MIQAATATTSFWQQATQGEFTGVGDVTLPYVYFKQDNPKGTLVLCTGRCETYLKYQELLEELFQQGWNLFSWDHRGQGLAKRLVPGSHMGHVEDFNFYVDDMASFIDQIVTPQQVGKLFLVAHSMGGAISTRYLQTRVHRVSAAVLSAPMYGITLPAPQWLLSPVVELLTRTHQWRGRAGYVPTGHDYVEDPFEGNPYSSSPERYEASLALYRNQPELQLGEPSCQWLQQSFKAMDALRHEVDQLQVPTLVLQGELEQVVCNRAMDRVCNLSAAITKEVILGGRHELFIEDDPMRRKALEHTCQWLELHNQ
ncbi:alpha/beta fold hydrolase [Ferrimonas aestuarii]|uniref:Alpha/beta fold hydrolase n=1 Tax=Ferrimonas aestuarii TaxID=2569539 RepID=A0A4U1BQE7_9GAMM|nr:alpha/beta fold hydrolase [Ferrimonas aestuarii]TKB56200.1 alpha/beta fold hydrolase [Ferrimonas aestuarii]